MMDTMEEDKCVKEEIFRRLLLLTYVEVVKLYRLNNTANNVLIWVQIEHSSEEILILGTLELYNHLSTYNCQVIFNAFMLSWDLDILIHGGTQYQVFH